MSLFTGHRLPADRLGLDFEGLRRGLYSDKYFENVAQVLSALTDPNAPKPPHQPDIGDIHVEAQVFNRRAPFAVVGGVDSALAMLQHTTGYYDGETFINTAHELDIEAIHDGDMTHYDGDPSRVQPVLRIRGRYRDFTLLETPILGVLSRITRIATSVYHVMHAAKGKQVLFFPARFDLPQTQAEDGYAYWLGVQRYNHETGAQCQASVSTRAQGLWWGGTGGGTVPHALIACFDGDTVQTMLAFARTTPAHIPRIVLADFDNDTTATSRATLTAYWEHYRAALLAGDETEQRRWTLHGVRLDTAANMLDAALTNPADSGVSPALVRAVRESLDTAYESWNETGALLDAARDYCRQVQIVVTGGFNRERIEQFERDGVPADVYGVGSTFLRNDRDTNTDYTMDVVRVRINGTWQDVAKVGRQRGENPALQPVTWSE